MKKEELEKLIYLSNVPERWYRINDGLEPDAYIIFKNYSIWEYFYLDEKGSRNECLFFTNEEDAYDQLWEDLKYLLKVYQIKPRENN